MGDLRRTALLAFCLTVTFVDKCNGACTADSLLALQDLSHFNADKLDGHWYMTHLNDPNAANTAYTAYTFDVVPTSQGITVYLNVNTSNAAGECEYIAVRLKDTSDPTRFVYETPNGRGGGSGEQTQTVFVAVSPSGNTVLQIFCDGDVSGAENCRAPRAMVMGREPNQPAAARWLESFGNPLPCFDTPFDEFQQDGPECPFKPVWGLPGTDCRVDTFPVQQNFDVNRWLGVWYELSWLAWHYIPDDAKSRDYSHTYTLNSDGNITKYVAGRSPQDDLCHYSSYEIFMTDTPGKMFEYIPGHEHTKSDYIMVSTDYDHYAIVYGCDELSNTTGDCVNAHAWLWSRDVTLDRQLLLQANSILQSICLNPGAFLSTPHNQDCLQEALSSTTHGPGGPTRCVEGDTACANQPDSVRDDSTTYCCHAHQTVSLRTVAGATVCTCTDN